MKIDIQKLYEQAWEKAQPRYQSERDFVKAFFDSDDEWIYEPTVFNLGNNAPKNTRKFATYRPDFFDKRRGVYIEVSLNWQAYLINLPKYTALRMMYPDIRFEIRNPDGTMFEENPIWNGPRVRRFAQLAALLVFNPFTTPVEPFAGLGRYEDDYTPAVRQTVNARA